MIVDYRAFNKLTVIEKFTMAIIEEIVNNFSGYKYFTSLDLALGYH